MKPLRKFLEWFDDVTVSAVLALLLILIGPLVLSVYLLMTGKYLPGGSFALLWCGLIAAGVRDIRVKKLGWITVSLLVLWLILTALIVLALAFAE